MGRENVGRGLSPKAQREIKIAQRKVERLERQTAQERKAWGSGYAWKNEEDPKWRKGVTRNGGRGRRAIKKWWFGK